MALITYTAQMYYHHDRGDGWGHPWMALVFFVLLGTVIGVVIWAVVRAGRAPQPQFHAPGPAVDPAMETLRMRFARGEIDANEYAARAAQLSGAAPPPAPPVAPPTS